jgi:uncharacterized membrane protein
MPNQRRNDRLCLAMAILVVAVSIGYWSAFSINAYYTFHEFRDLGTVAYSMYYHIYQPQIMHGLQYIVFQNHLSPDQLLVMGIFYLFQSPLTLLFVQAAVLSLTGLLVFFIVKDLLKDSFLGLLLCVAFLLNPGMHGMLVYDYHVEFLIIPFVLLTFYFFMKKRKVPMYVSLALLLGSLETATFVAVALGLGLLAYELVYAKRKHSKADAQKIRLSLHIIAISAVVAVAYAYAGQLLVASYAHGLYPGLPLDFQVLTFGSDQVRLLLSLFGVGGGAAASVPNYLVHGVLGGISPIYIFYGILVVIAAFGISALFVPEVTFFMILPWLVEGFVVGNVRFFLLWYNYFSYVIGGIVVATILSFMAIKDGTNRFSEELEIIGGQNPKRKLYQILLFGALVIWLLSWVFVISANLSDPAENFLFQVPAYQANQIGQLYSIMALVPANASVMGPGFVEPHFTQRLRDINMNVSVGRQGFVPEYFITDFNSNVNPQAFNFNQPIIANGILANYSYYLYAQEGTAKLYRLANDS